MKIGYEIINIINNSLFIISFFKFFNSVCLFYLLFLFLWTTSSNSTIIIVNQRIRWFFIFWKFLLLFLNLYLFGLIWILNLSFLGVNRIHLKYFSQSLVNILGSHCLVYSLILICSTFFIIDLLDCWGEIWIFMLVHCIHKCICLCYVAFHWRYNLTLIIF